MKKITLKADIELPSFEALIQSYAGSNSKFLLLLANKSQIKNAIKEFEDHGPNKHNQTVHQCRLNLRNQLIECYDDATKNAKKILNHVEDLIYEGDRGICSYCGLSEDTELDHYLPKKKFPFLCVYPMNLIPICGVCNKKKGVKYELSGKKIFLYPPLDQFIENKCLKAEIIILQNSAKVSFSVIKNPTFSTDQIDTISLHFKTLGLSGRYMEQAVSYICRMRADFKKMNFSLQQKKIRIRTSLKNALDEEHPNHWKIATLEALLNCIHQL